MSPFALFLEILILSFVWLTLYIYKPWQEKFNVFYYWLPYIILGLLFIFLGRVIYFAYFFKEKSIESEEDILKSVDNFMKKKQFDDAVYLCKKYLSIEQSYKVMRMLAKCFIELKQYDDALKLYEELYDLDNESIIEEFADLNLVIGKYNEALRLYYEIILLYPDREDLYNKILEIIRKLPLDNETAKKFFRVYFKRKKNNVDGIIKDNTLLFYYLWFLYKEKNRDDFFNILNSIKDKDLSYELYRFIIKILIKYNDFKKAFYYIEKFLDNKEEKELLKYLIINKKLSLNGSELSYEYLDRITDIFSRLGLVECIVPLYYTFIEYNKKDFRVYKFLIDYNIKNKRFKQVIDLIEKAFKTIPNSLSNLIDISENLLKKNMIPELFNILQKMKAKKQQFEKEIKSMEDKFEKEKDNIDFLERFYLLLRDTGNYSRAMEIVKRLLEISPDSKKYKLYKLELLLFFNEVDVIKEFFYSFTNDPLLLSDMLDFTDNFIFMGIENSYLVALSVLEVLIVLGDIKKGISFAKKYLKIFKEDSEIMLILAEFYIKNKDYDKCLELIQRVTFNDPEYENRRLIITVMGLVGMKLFDPAKKLLSKVDYEAISNNYLKRYLWELGNLFMGLKKFDDAKSILEKLAEIDAVYPGLQERLNLLKNKIENQNKIRDILSKYFKDIEEMEYDYTGNDFKCYATGLNKVVIVKILNENTILDEKIKDNFINKYKNIMKKLKHKNIVKVYDIVDDKMPYIVMELMNGMSLRNIIEKKANMSIRLCKVLFSQILNAIYYAHKNDIIHGNLRPANIMMTPKAEIKIKDFGFYMLLDIPTLMKKNVLIDTFFYMSPEQLKGDKIDKKADIYSVGAIFYEILTFDKPFKANDSKTLFDNILKNEITPIFSLRNDLSEELSNIILKAMAEKPEDRYRDILEFSEKLLNCKWERNE